MLDQAGVDIDVFFYVFNGFNGRAGRNRSENWYKLFFVSKGFSISTEKKIY